MIYLETDSLIRISKFLALLQMFEIPENVLPLVHIVFVHFFSAAKAKQLGSPPHLFTREAMTQTVTVTGPYSLENFRDALPNVLEYISFLHDCNLLIKMIDTIAPYLHPSERQDMNLILDLFLNILHVAFAQFPIDLELHLSCLLWTTKRPYPETM